MSYSFKKVGGLVKITNGTYSFAFSGDVFIDYDTDSNVINVRCGEQYFAVYLSSNDITVDNGTTTLSFVAANQNIDGTTLYEAIVKLFSRGNSGAAGSSNGVIPQYATVTAALAAISTGRTLGMTVQIVDADISQVSEYWFQGGTDDVDFVQKSTGGVSRTDQVITFNQPAAKTYGGANFALGATSTSGLPVTYQFDDPTILTQIGTSDLWQINNAGSVQVTALQVGNGSFNAAASVVRTLVVNKADQTITFVNPGARSVNNGAFASGATASSGLPVSLASSNAAKAAVNGLNITPLEDGTATITATQQGDNNHNAASSVVRTFAINVSEISIGTTMFTAADIPAQLAGGYSGLYAAGFPDGLTGIEMGVKFSVTSNGYISGLRFYKSTGNTGVHVGSIWTTGGTRIATATFVNETAQGWQQVYFDAPIAVTAGTVYIASYHSNVGYYVSDSGSFSARKGANGVYALADGESGPNGVYVYSANSTFPTQAAAGINYWVDVLFEQTATRAYDTDTLAYTSIAGYYGGNTSKDAMDDLVKRLKANGLWADIARLYMPYGSVPNGKKLDVRYPSQAANYLLFPNGLTDDGTDKKYYFTGYNSRYANTQLNASALDSTNFCLMTYQTLRGTNSTDGVCIHYGASDGTNELSLNATARNFNAKVGTTTFNMMADDTKAGSVFSDGFYSLSVKDGVMTFDVAGFRRQQAISGVTLPAQPLFLGALNASGTATIQTGQAQNSFYIVTKNITPGKQTVLASILKKYLVSQALWAAPAGAMFYGDSITQGYAATNLGSTKWTSLVCAAKGWTEEVNYGVTGITIQKANGNTNTVPDKVSASASWNWSGLKPYNERMNRFFIAYGINDVFQYNNTNNPAADFDTALRGFIDQVIAMGWPASKIVMLSTYFIDTTQVQAGSDARQTQFNQYLQQAAIDYGFVYCDVYTAMANNGGTSLLSSSDHIHPTDAGHAVIASNGVLPMI